MLEKYWINLRFDLIENPLINISTLQYFYIFFVALMVSVISLPSIFASQDESEIELEGNVTHVADGDTLDINGITVRLSLVNTSERGQEGFI